jgi:hypothetical protein
MPVACTFLLLGKFCATRDGVCGPVVRCLRSAPRATEEIPISPTRIGADPNSPSRDPTHRGRAQSRKLFRREFASTTVELFARLCTDHGSPTTPASVTNPIVEKNFSKLVAAPKVKSRPLPARADGVAEKSQPTLGVVAHDQGPRSSGRARSAPRNFGQPFAAATRERAAKSRGSSPPARETTCLSLDACA